MRVSAPDPDDFIPGKFKKKSTKTDCIIYLVALVIVAGVGGGCGYYFTRSEPEKEQLRARFGMIAEKAGVKKDTDEIAARSFERKKTPELDRILGNEEAVSSAPLATARPASVKPGAVSTYSGGGANRVVLSEDPKLPAASTAFVQLIEAFKVSGVVDDKPAKVMLNGRMFRAGDTIDPEQRVTFVGLDAGRKLLHFRDDTGAEIRLSY